MAVPEYLKTRLKEIPSHPGVYLFKNRENKAIYIGKALSLKKRIAGHFRNFSQSSSKEGLMLSQVAGIDVLETSTDAEALLLEASLVKEQLPKYNQLLRDDKSYPFPMRTCRKLPAKVCLMYHIGQCGGPCESFQPQSSYLAVVKELEAFLTGRRDALVRNLAKRMKDCSDNREYEKAKTHYELMKALSSIPAASSLKAEDSGRLEDFQKIFSLPSLPRRMECYDISNIQGHEPVGSMVVFQDGKPSRSEYRRFHVKTVRGIDDYRMMREVVGRSYRRRLEEKKPLPDLVVIDGGKGHLLAAKAELDGLGLKALPILSIAKEHEIIFSPDREKPFVLSAASPVLQLVRHLRDEAHRFAISFHRRLHRKAALVSQLDSIHGLGPKGRQKLLKNFGTVYRMKEASLEQLVQKAGLNQKAAAAVFQALRGSPPR
jgi:excinuclease ABC subunit C